MTTRSGRAFTLTELLAVVAVVAVIAGLLLPAIFRAKRSARGASDIEAMHQLGVAALMYHDEGGDWPPTCGKLIEAGNLPRDLCASREDPYEKGLANFALEIASTRSRYETTYKRSYIGFGDKEISPNVFARDYAMQPNAGWLLNVVEMKQEPAGNWPFYGWSGPYQRLLLDGSVRRYICVPTTKVEPGGGGSASVSIIHLFSDPGPEWDNR